MKQSLSVVIPAYNEGENIAKTVRETENFLRKIKPLDWEIVVVDDGSSDATWTILKKLKKESPYLKIFRHSRNRGIGEAWKTLYRKAKKDLIFTLPADGQIKANELKKFLPLINQYEIIVGVRKKRNDPWSRRLFSGIYNFFLRWLFKLKVKDINSIKLYKKEVLVKCRPWIGSAFGEAEILIKAQKKGFKVGEVEIDHFPRQFGRQTGANFRVAWRALRDLWQFWWLLR